MTKHTQVEAKSTSTPIPAMQPAHFGLLPQQEQEELERSLLPAEDWRRSPNSPNLIPINPPLVGHSFGSMAICPTTSPLLQRKLTIGQPNDRYEQEADQVGAQVMRMPELKVQRRYPECKVELQRQPMAAEEKKKEDETLQTKPLAETISPLIQRQTEPTEEEKKEEEETLQTKPASGEASTVSPVLQNQITALQGGGQPLPESERHFFEPRFGTDFSQVRIHTNNQAAEAAHAVNARAFTLGRDVVFGRGQFAPRTSKGLSLLAHELTHVVQQSSSHNSPASSPGKITQPDSMQTQASETQTHYLAQQLVSKNSINPIVPDQRATQYLQKATAIGTRVTHPTGSTNPHRSITAEFDGREFIVSGSGRELLRTSAQSGRPYTVRPADATRCGGSANDSYLNNPRYVGVADNGPIPEGEYQFRATEMTTFSLAEQAQMLTGGSFTDPFGRSLHGGDWGAGRVALHKIRVLPSPMRGCGNTATRSGFFLHGGIMPGSSGCIDIGNSAFNSLVSLLSGYRNRVIVTVRYRHPAPTVGAIDRALGRFTYPGGENPTLIDRLRGLFGETPE